MASSISTHSITIDYKFMKSHKKFYIQKLTVLCAGRRRGSKREVVVAAIWKWCPCWSQRKICIQTSIITSLSMSSMWIRCHCCLWYCKHRAYRCWDYICHQSRWVSSSIFLVLKECKTLFYFTFYIYIYSNQQ